MGIRIDRTSGRGRGRGRGAQNKPWIDFNLLFECVGLAAISRLANVVDCVS